MLLEITFLLGFLLHNLEEYIWLPKWSENSGNFHPQVSRGQFGILIFAVSLFGIVITYLFINQNYSIVTYLYYAFVLIMVLNVVFPHIIATIILRRYAPGLATALLMNLPLGVLLLGRGLNSGINHLYLAITALGLISVFAVFVVAVLNFKKQ